MEYPSMQTLSLNNMGGILHVSLNRPKVRNAMNLSMVEELQSVFDQAEQDERLRGLVLRGAEGHFCAGADIQDMAKARATQTQSLKIGDVSPFQKLNRAFGRLITRVANSPLIVISVLEGSVLGGGLGLACVSDFGLCQQSTRFGLPETSLGIPPAQIAPFVVKRVGLTHARRLALFGERFNGKEALSLGLVHECHNTPEALNQALEHKLVQLRGCAPKANRVTKALLLAASDCHDAQDLDALLDHAAEKFAEAVVSEEGTEGTTAFLQKRAPQWATS